MSVRLNKDKATGAAVGAFLLLWIAMAVGWVMNIVKLFGLQGSTFNDVGVEMIIRIAGIPLVPLGGIFGYF